MRPAGGLATYGRVLRHGPAVRPFTAAVVARLPVSMAPLGMVLVVQDVRGSYAVAGLVTGAFAVGTAVGAPVWGRAMDRFGQARVLVPTVAASAGLIAALALATVAGVGVPGLVQLALGAGATFPPFSAAMRAAWRVVFAEGPERRAAYALDAVAVETIFVGGPLLLSLLLVTTPPAVPLLVTAALLAAGGLAYSCTEPARTRYLPPMNSEPAPGKAGARPLVALVAGLPPVLAVSVAMAVAFGAIDTSLAATAREVLGQESRLGLLFTAIAGGSALGGLAYGTLPASAHEHRRLAFTLGVFALGLAPLPLLLSGNRPPLWALLPLLFVAGVAVAPSLIIQQNLVDRFAPAGRHNEAQAWLSTAITTGAASGTALAGALIDGGGVAWSFALAVAAGGAAAAVALIARSSWAALSQADPAAPEGAAVPAGAAR